MDSHTAEMLFQRIYSTFGRYVPQEIIRYHCVFDLPITPYYIPLIFLFFPSIPLIFSILGFIFYVVVPRTPVSMRMKYFRMHYRSCIGRTDMDWFVGYCRMQMNGTVIRFYPC
jgi:hypothetical protein